MSTVTPAAFGGLWQRSALTLDGRPVEDRATVLWLQVADRFVDVRTGIDGLAAPLSGPGMFAGTTDWDEPALTWHHRVDSATGAVVDTGTIEWLDSATVLEHGETMLDGRPCVYRETWERVTEPGLRGSVLWDEPDGVALGVGHHRLAIAAHGIEWAAVHQIVESTTGAWVTVLTAGSTDGSGTLQERLSTDL